MAAVDVVWLVFQNSCLFLRIGEGGSKAAAVPVKIIPRWGGGGPAESVGLSKSH